MSETDLVAWLNALIAVEFDALEAYDAALAHLENEGALRQLREYRDDHERHVTDLSTLVDSIGGSPADHGDLKRLLTRGKVVFGTVAGDMGILAAMRSNETGTNETYERALAHVGLPQSVKSLLTRHLSDERRHRGWIESAAAEVHRSSFPPPIAESG
ncbi:MAG TPA: ferritin-like domain-containing protein [Polyangiaceae bacterium]|jgi:uncharacterized protein (TIGR02284 family)